MVKIMRYDLIITGAGISGCICALSAIKYGIDANKILIIEKSKKPGGLIPTKIDFAEDIGISKIFTKLGIPVYHKTNKSIWISPNGTEFEFISKISDIWVKRGPADDSFETTIINNLKNLGVDILFKTEGIKIIDRTIKVAYNNKFVELNSMIFVDAGGFESRLSKNIKKPSYTKIFGCGFWGENLNLEKNVPYIFFNQKFAAGSYVLANIDPKTDIGYLLFGTKNKTKISKLKKIMNENKILEHITKDMEIYGNITGSLYTIHEVPTIFQTDNLILVGDSARLMDPFLHYGIQPSVISGYFAGKIIANYLNNNENINVYSKIIRDYCKKYLKRRIFYRKIFDKLGNEDIDKVFLLMNKLKENNINIDQFFEKPLLHLPSILKVTFRNMGDVFSVIKNILKT